MEKYAVLRPMVFEKLHRFTPVTPKYDWCFDTIKPVRISGAKALRHILLIREEHINIMTLSLGRIGRHDVGRTLVVDVYQDGNQIDVITDAVA
jgi:hypothetical protein